MKCKTKGCEEEAYLISAHDKPHKFDKLGKPTELERTVKYRCDRKHISTTKKTIAYEEFKPNDKLPSINRFKKKGFKDHVKGFRDTRPEFPPKLTNHQRHLARQERRRQLRAMKEVKHAGV